MSAAAGANATNVAYWNDVMVERFERFRATFTRVGDEHSRGPLERAGLAPGMRALDVGCGFGETTLQIAARVAPGGSVVGTDCCPPFLDVARADALAAGIGNAEFRVADAQTDTFPPEFGLVFARFGTMFFQDPVAGMRNIRTALAPGGRLLMIVWRELGDNEWLSFAREIVGRHLPPPEDAPVRVGGPFSMADPELVESILTDAGYTDVLFERTDASALVGETVEDAIAFQLAIGPAAELFRLSPEESERRRSAIEAELRAVLERHARADGVWMDTSSWAVTATAP